MTTSTLGQLNAPNLTVQSAGTTFAYRRFGNSAADGTPLVFFQHFRGNLDNWDPALVDVIAAQREVILFDNAGVGGSTGTTPRTISAMTTGALAFLDTLHLDRVDLLGFSIGGYIAQDLALQRPQLVRRLVLASTGPEGGFGMHGLAPDVLANATLDEPTAESLLYLFFSGSQASKDKGREFIGRIFARADDRDAPVSLAVRDAQLDAFNAWGIADPGKLIRLTNITAPALVANGDNDIMIPTRNSHLLGGFLPDATVTIYPDAGHGFLFQYAEQFAAQVLAFLT